MTLIESTVIQGLAPPSTKMMEFVSLLSIVQDQRYCIQCATGIKVRSRPFHIGSSCERHCAGSLHSLGLLT